MQSPEYAAKGIELVADEMKAVAEGKGFCKFTSPFLCCFQSFVNVYTLKKHIVSFGLYVLSVNQKHLNRAKAATKSAILMNLESRVDHS